MANGERILVETAIAYHRLYASEIAYRIAESKHLSILFPSLMGTFPIIPNIYDFLDYRDRMYVIVDSYDQISYINDLIFNFEREDDCIYPILIDDYLENRPNGDCLILFNLKDSNRRKLTEILRNLDDTLVISVGKLLAEDNKLNKNQFVTSHANEILNELHSITLFDGKPHCMIFEVKSILDIRDIAYAEESEKESLLKTLYEICDKFERDLQRMDGYFDNTDKLILRERAREELELQVGFLRTVAASSGVDIIMLDECLKQISQLKAEYAKKFENTNDEVELESLETSFQTDVAELNVKATNNFLTIENNKDYENRLIKSLSDRVWNKLTKFSKTYLISALMTFESLDKLPDKEQIDFSGVCLQVTKVLDEEMALRLYNDYKKYLNNLCINDWPYAMKVKRADGKFVALPDHKFTLGSIARVIGYDVRNKELSDKMSFESMRKYAKAKLFDEKLSDKDVEQKLILIAECAEKTRNDYRNPAAHRNKVTCISARDCLAYLVEQTKMLKKIMEYMRY